MNRFFAVLIFLLLYSFAFAANEDRVETVEVVVQATSSQDGDALPAYNEENPEVTILRVEIPQGHKVAIHKHSLINAVYVASGQLTLEIEGGQKNVVNAGEAVIDVIEKWHDGFSSGDEPAVLIVFYAGIQGQSLSEIRQSE